jgi:hypothetical protein
MTTVSLQEAKAAKAEVERLLRLKEAADALPALEKQLEQDRETQAAMTDLDAAKAQAKADLDLAKLQIASWRERFDTVAAELEQLGAELPGLHKLTVGVGVAIRDAVERVALARAPDAFRGVGPAWFRHFEEVGGTDQALALPGSVGRDPDAELMALLCKRTRTRPYNPRLGVKFFG